MMPAQLFGVVLSIPGAFVPFEAFVRQSRAEDPISSPS